MRLRHAFVLLGLLVVGWLLYTRLATPMPAYIDGVNAAKLTEASIFVDNLDYADDVAAQLSGTKLRVLTVCNAVNPKSLFTYLDRSGADAFDAQEWLKEAIIERRDALKCLFDSNERAQAELMEARVPDVVSAYQDFLDSPAARNAMGDIIVVRTRPIRELRDVPWTTQKVAMIIEDEKQQRTVYVYRQVAR
ncbi:MAG: hypothetical protein J0M34_03955 [Alphaproteobacteria bacterium]|nr:hypothetical protein [Alphaproteobacteria bacterium]